MTPVVIDTDVLIDAAAGVEAAVQSLAQLEASDRPFISAVTQMELLVGCRNKGELQKTDRFLQRFEIVRIDGGISDSAVQLLRQYRLSHGLLIPDALIAATALSLNQPLVTKNQRDFRFIDALQLLPYPALS